MVFRYRSYFFNLLKAFFKKSLTKGFILIPYKMEDKMESVYYLLFYYLPKGDFYA